MIIEIIVFIDFYKCVLLPLLVMISKVLVNGVASQIPEPNSRRYHFSINQVYARIKKSRVHVCLLLNMPSGWFMCFLIDANIALVVPLNHRHYNTEYSNVSNY